MLNEECKDAETSQILRGTGHGRGRFPLENEDIQGDVHHHLSSPDTERFQEGAEQTIRGSWW